MRDFHCVCGTRVYFENSECLNCGRALGFDPDALSVVALDAAGGDGAMPSADADSGARYRFCRNRAQHCNWLVPGASDEPWCLSCRLTATLPNLSLAENTTLWARLEAAKRRLLYDLLSLGLPVGGQGGLRFKFLQDKRTNPLVREMHVYTGHRDGVITINVAEADDVAREAIRKAMGESYRTLLGHLRHESGHYYWPLVVDEPSALAECRRLFGDERIDYKAALERHHRQGPPPDWQSRHISAYASSHPQEDWAECWAHFLHIADTMETARVAGLIAEGAGVGADDWLDQWSAAVIWLNELNRSLGLRDPYPFVLNTATREKLEFIRRRVVCSPSPSSAAAAPRTPA